jgi:LacI family transcriptional regulator
LSITFSIGYIPDMDANRRVTIREVAEAAGVSVATVSKVLNDRYGVSGATAEKVRAVIEELGYESSLVARSLRNTKTNVIGVLVADFEPFSLEVLKGAADAIRGTGYELVVYSAAGQAVEHVGWERRHLSRVSGTLVDGAVLVTPTCTDVAASIPIVAIDPHTGRSHIPTIDSDNLRGGHRAVEHLLGLGHRRIAMITGRPDLESARARERGYRDALEAAGIPVDESLIEQGDFLPATAAAATRRLLALPDPPTAIFAANDAMALAAIEVATKQGLTIPADLSVVGFDNVPDSAMTAPGLTTVEQPIREMGRRALELLLEQIQHGVPRDPHLTLATRLMVRGSTAPPRQER